MKKYGIMIAFICAVVLCCQPSTVAAATFSDISGHWGESFIYYAADAGLLHGYGDGSFHPNNNITRAEFTTILALESGENMDAYAKETGFSDVKTTFWGNKFICWGKENSVIFGYEDGSFRPDRNITREEVCSLLYRYIKDYRKLSLKETANTVTFSDEGAVSGWALTAVKAMQRSAIVSGKGNQIFDPKANTTRAEAAVMISKYLKQYRIDDSSIYMTTDIYYNGALKAKDVTLTKSGNTIMIPMRTLLTAASFRTTYFNASQIVVADNISHDLECKLDQTTFYANGTKFTFSAAPNLQGGVTYVPLYEIATRLGLSAAFHAPGTDQQYLSVTGSSSLLSLNVNNFYGEANTAEAVNGSIYLAKIDPNSGFYGTLLNGAMSYGSYKTTGGDLYCGNWSNHQPNGAGRYISKSGTFFVGIFNDGVKTNGVTYFADGSRFEGSWTMGTNGTLSPAKGKLFTVDGKTYGSENAVWSYGGLSQSNW